MPAAVSPERGPEPAANDDLDDLFADLIGTDANANSNGNAAGRQASWDQPNNMDEEVKVTKKRKPVAKLDENRLLSAAGIPKLRKISKDKLRFNGKGNEFTDMAKLLGTYQLWLDDLFPKAKFLDGLAMIEKLGHKKKIQIYRKEWIDESKPRNFEDDLDDFVASRTERVSEQQTTEQTAEGVQYRRDDSNTHQVGMQDTTAHSGPSAEPNTRLRLSHESDECDLDDLLRETAMEDSTAVRISLRQPGASDNAPDEDELDALLAEETAPGNSTKSLFGGPVSSTGTSAQQPANDSFADDEEAMAGVEW